LTAKCQKEGNMFSIFYEDGHRGIEIKSTGQRWFLENDYEISAFVRWLNEPAAQQSEQAKVAPCEHKNTSPDLPGFIKCLDCGYTIRK